MQIHRSKPKGKPKSPVRGTKDPLTDKPSDLKTKILGGTYEERTKAIQKAAETKDSSCIPALIDRAIANEKGNVISPTEDAETLDDEIIMINEAIQEIGLKKADLDRVITLLKEGDVHERITATWIIRYTQPQGILPIVIEGLKDGDETVKGTNAGTIMQMAETGVDCASAIEPLFSALKKEGRSEAKFQIRSALKALGISEKEIDGRIVDLTDLSDPNERALQRIESALDDDAERVKRLTGIHPNGALLSEIYGYCKDHPEMKRSEAIMVFFKKKA
ncbi:MAG: hypothetical protein V1861_00165 [Candidatus Micrarchaeota archaeon]